MAPEVSCRSPVTYHLPAAVPSLPFAVVCPFSNSRSSRGWGRPRFCRCFPQLYDVHGSDADGRGRDLITVIAFPHRFRVKKKACDLLPPGLASPRLSFHTAAHSSHARKDSSVVVVASPDPFYAANKRHR